MSRRHESKARRKKRRERIAAQHARIFAPLPPGTSSGSPGWARSRGPITFTFRGGASFTLQRAGPAVPFDPAIHSPVDLPLMVVNEMLRQAIPRPAGEPDIEN